MPLLPWLLAMVFALTGGTMATARGQMVQGDAVVICSGYGVVTIHVDAQGEPVGTVQPCPDCTMHLVFDLVPPVPALLRPATRSEPLAQPPGPSFGRGHRGFSQARAPPFSRV